jgi:predicted amidophosphoribosyltransferase
MSLVSCPECQNQGSDRAPACPRCGMPLSPCQRNCPRSWEQHQFRSGHLRIRVRLLASETTLIRGKTHRG